MYRIETCDADSEAGYSEYLKKVFSKEHAFAVILDAEAEHHIPSHRLTITRYLQDPEAEDGYYIMWSKNAEEFMAENDTDIKSMVSRLQGQ